MARPARAPAAREAWAGNPPLPSAARERRLEATVRCVVRNGLAATGVSSVAAEAGVSRPTVYRYFEDRRELVRATLMRAGAALGADLARHLEGFDEPDRMAVEAMLFVLREVPRSPLLTAMWSSTLLDAAMLADFTQPEIVASAREALAPLIAAAGWSAAEADEGIELMVRVLLSLLVAPAPARSPAALRRFLRQRLLPGLGLTPEAGHTRH